MNNNTPQYIEGKGWISETKHSMMRRKPWHDYYQKGTYMLTMAVQNRVPRFGTLSNDGTRIHVELSALGQAIQETEIKKIHQVYPMIKIWKLCIMPDHLHMIIHVYEEMPKGKHLGQVVAGFKGGCSRAAMRLGVYGNVLPPAVSKATIDEVSASSSVICQSECSDNGGNSTSDKQGKQVIPLFEPGYNDKILLADGILERWKAYLDDNPRRLWIKRQHPDFFIARHDLDVERRKCQCIGNLFLLNIPDKAAVIVHSRYTEEEKAKLKTEWLACGERGGVLVCTGIAPKEKEIMHIAMERGYRVIQLLENGFPPLYKPMGQSFYACAAGKLLQISPWEYHMEKKSITRAQCLELNALAENISLR